MKEPRGFKVADKLSDVRASISELRFIVMIRVHTLHGQSKRANRRRVLMAAKLQHLSEQGVLSYQGINRRGQHVFAKLLGVAAR